MKAKSIILSFSFLLLLSVTLSAQQPSRFPILPGSVWRINYEYSCVDSFVHQLGDEEYYYFVSGDTVINSRTYFKLYKSGILYLESPLEIKNRYMGAIRDSADRFFYVENKKASEYLLYNFSAKVGELICNDSDGNEYKVWEIDTLANRRKKFYIDLITVHCGSTNSLIEGIGWLGGLLEGNACYFHPGVRGAYLVCYSENGIPAYETEFSRCDKKINCSTDITAVKQPLFSETPEITILPGGRIEICLSDGSNNRYTVEIFTVDGRKIYQQEAELPGIIESGKLSEGTFLIRIVKDRMVYCTKYRIR